MLIFATQILDVAQLVAHLVRDQEVARSSRVIQTSIKKALADASAFSFIQEAFLIHFQRGRNRNLGWRPAGCLSEY